MVVERELADLVRRGACYGQPSVLVATDVEPRSLDRGRQDLWPRAPDHNGRRLAVLEELCEGLVGDEAITPTDLASAMTGHQRPRTEETP